MLANIAFADGVVRALPIDYSGNATVIDVNLAQNTAGTNARQGGSAATSSGSGGIMPTPKSTADIPVPLDNAPETAQISYDEKTKTYTIRVSTARVQPSANTGGMQSEESPDTANGSPQLSQNAGQNATAGPITSAVASPVTPQAGNSAGNPSQGPAQAGQPECADGGPCRNTPAMPAGQVVPGIAMPNSGSQVLKEAPETKGENPYPAAPPQSACIGGNCEGISTITMDISGISIESRPSATNSTAARSALNAILEVDVGKEKITLKKNEGRGTEISSNGVAATTTEKIEISEGKMKVAGSPVSLMPGGAAQKAAQANGNQVVQSISIKAQGPAGAPVYVVEGKRQAKILGIIPVEIGTTTKIDAQTEQVVSVEKPWWSILLTE